MKRPATKIVVAAAAVGVGMIVLASVKLARRGLQEGPASSDEVPCGAGFFRQGTRCCPTSVSSAAGAAQLCAVGPPASCPAPLVVTPRGCDAPDHSVVRVPATSVRIGPSDWEAEGRVRPRIVRAGPFAIDRFEVTNGYIGREGPDPGRAASEISLHEARAICARRGGRVPTEDEWIVAAAGDRPRRYPWGDTGAVCRRAAWGLARGPCGSGATGPDTVGAHPDGATPLGVHDLAGNVAEWVDAPDPKSRHIRLAFGASWWAMDDGYLSAAIGGVEMPSARNETVGFRCAADVLKEP